MIIGLGTGRCGTSSLSELLNLPHEVKPILTSSSDPHERYRALNEGDVGFYYIHIIQELLDTYDIAAVCLKRDKNDTVESLHNHVKQWREPPSFWEISFPDHDFHTKEGIREYYDWYYKTIFNLISKGYPIEIWETESLPIHANKRDKWTKSSKNN